MKSYLKHNFKELIDFNNRSIGLDIVRFVAVFYIFWGHGAILIPNEFKNIYEKLLIIPIEGVSTFFVLSGYLIGGILIKNITGTKFTFKVLFNFFKRRWFRTLPAYFFVLLFLIIFKFQEWHFDFRYFLFLQNFISNNFDFFHVSWSLSVEECFYFFFPVVFFLISKIFDVKRSLVFSIIIFIFFPLLLRIISIDNQELDVRQIVIFRLDSMMYGVSLSVINCWYPRVWQFLLKRGWIFFLFLVFIQYTNIVLSNPYYERIFVFNMEAIMVFLIIPIFSTIRSLKFNILNKFIVFNSKLSYSIYLTHASIILWWWLRDIDNSGYLGDYRFEFQRIIFFGLYFVLTYVLSIFIYVFIEQPFLKLREKYTNS